MTPDPFDELGPLEQRQMRKLLAEEQTRYREMSDKVLTSVRQVLTMFSDHSPSLNATLAGYIERFLHHSHVALQAAAVLEPNRVAIVRYESEDITAVRVLYSAMHTQGERKVQDAAWLTVSALRWKTPLGELQPQEAAFHLLDHLAEHLQQRALEAPDRLVAASIAGRALVALQPIRALFDELIAQGNVIGYEFYSDDFTVQDPSVGIGIILRSEELIPTGFSVSLDLAQLLRNAQELASDIHRHPAYRHPSTPPSSTDTP